MHFQFALIGLALTMCTVTKSCRVLILFDYKTAHRHIRRNIGDQLLQTMRAAARHSKASDCADAQALMFDSHYRDWEPSQLQTIAQEH